MAAHAVVTFVYRDELLAQTFLENSTVDESGQIPPTHPSSYFSMLEI